MKYHLTTKAGLLISSLFIFTVTSAQFVQIRGRQLITPDGKELHLKSIGLGNWLVQEGYMFEFGDNHSEAREIIQLIKELIGPATADSFWEKYYQTYITKADIDFLHHCGFNCVRVPFNYRLLTPEDFPGIWEGPGWKALDNVIKWCRADHMYVVLDMHCAPGGQTGANIDDSYGYPFLYESPASQERLISIWEKIVTKYRNNATVLGYDLMNEPIPHRAYYDQLKPLLEPIYKRVTTAIRKIDPHHIIILEASNWDTDFTCFDAPFAKQLLYEFHFYWQPPVLKGIEQYIDFSKKYDVPIWLGESGENTDEWITQFRKLLEQQDIGWSFWPYKKMNSTRGVVSVNEPDNWKKIIWYSNIGAGEEEREKEHVHDSISVNEAQTAFKEYLQNIQFKNCRVNNAYLEALGLKPDDDH